MGKAFEVIQRPSGVTEYRQYITAAGETVAVITDASGQLVSRYHYDPFGQRQEVAWTDNTVSSLIDDSVNRGYTQHEYLAVLGLIHMNGRVYDPKLGRFLSADPFVQFPISTQGYNRYSYVGNNPLSFTDPSGYYLLFDVKRDEDGDVITDTPQPSTTPQPSVVSEEEREYDALDFDVAPPQAWPPSPGADSNTNPGNSNGGVNDHEEQSEAAAETMLADVTGAGATINAGTTTDVSDGLLGSDITGIPGPIVLTPGKNVNDIDFPKNVSTVVADGKGGLKIRFAIEGVHLTNPIVYEALRLHEQQHIDDFKEYVPNLRNILKGLPEGTTLNIDTKANKRLLEMRAHRVQINYLENNKPSRWSFWQRNEVEGQIWKNRSEYNRLNNFK